MFYNVIFLMTVIRIIEMQPVDYLSLAACVMHFHSSNDRFGIKITSWIKKIIICTQYYFSFFVFRVIKCLIQG